VHRRVVVLDPPVVSTPQQCAVGTEQRPTHRYAALGQAEACLLDRDREHLLV